MGGSEKRTRLYSGHNPDGLGCKGLLVARAMYCKVFEHGNKSMWKSAKDYERDMRE